MPSTPTPDGPRSLTGRARERLIALRRSGASPAEVDQALADYDRAAIAEGVRATADRLTLTDDQLSRLAVLFQVHHS